MFAPPQYMPSAEARGCKGVWGPSPQWGPGVRGFGDEVPQKQTLFNSVKCSFLMNNNIAFSFIIQSATVKLDNNTKLTNMKHKKTASELSAKMAKNSPSCRKLLNCIQILIIIIYCISWYICQQWRGHEKISGEKQNFSKLKYSSTESHQC